MATSLVIHGLDRARPDHERVMKRRSWEIGRIKRIFAAELEARRADGLHAEGAEPLTD